MTLPKDWWTTDLEDEPCDSCGAKPSKHEGHGSFTCKECYEKRWCPICHYDARPRGNKPHVCPSPEEREKNRIESAVTMLLIADTDKQREALTLAEELTRQEPHSSSFIPSCEWCGSEIGTPDGQNFVHKPDCKWKRLRDLFFGDDE